MGAWTRLSVILAALSLAPLAGACTIVGAGIGASVPPYEKVDAVGVLVVTTATNDMNIQVGSFH
jgi:hypothetical protein